MLINHLCRVAKKCDKNLMTIGNLAVCFGPTLLRPEEETVASIMDIKFYNIVVEILIENCEKISSGSPQETPNPGPNSPLSNPSSPRKEMKDDKGITGNGAVHMPCYSVHTVMPATVKVKIVKRSKNNIF